MDQTVMSLQEIIYRHAERKLQGEVYCKLNIVSNVEAINKKWRKDGPPILTSCKG